VRYCAVETLSDVVDEVVALLVVDVPDDEVASVAEVNGAGASGVEVDNDVVFAGEEAGMVTGGVEACSGSTMTERVVWRSWMEEDLVGSG